MMVISVSDFSTWEDDFIRYMEANGHTPGVAKDYARRVKKLLAEEHISVETLARDIDQWIDEYKTGKYAAVNNAHHHAPCAALLKFRAFVPTLSKPLVQDFSKLTDAFGGKVPTDIVF